MAVEEAAAKEGVAPKAVWRSVAKLARSLAVHRCVFQPIVDGISG